MKIGTKNVLLAFVGLALFPGFTEQIIAAASTTLPFRSEAGECLFNNTASQTIETNYGPSMTGVPFTQTTNYDFYSPPLASAATLLSSDRAGGTIEMANIGNQSMYDFHVTARMSFYDYDPVTGVNTLIVSTAASPDQKVNHSDLVHWPVPNTTLPAAATLPAGHLLHIVVTITLVSGNATYGYLVYNGPDVHGPDPGTTLVQLPQNRAIGWNFGALAVAPDATITASGTAVAPDSASNTAQVPNTPGATYAWSIDNGIITSGQGTRQITWTAGSPGSVSLAVTVTKLCSSTSGTAVRVMGAAGTVIGLTASTNSSMRVSCSGTPGQVYAVQATTNLAAPVWTTVGTATAGPDGLFNITDPNAANFICRFYRSASQ